jgi:predicted nuclease with TOPRIM domain
MTEQTEAPAYEATLIEVMEDAKKAVELINDYIFLNQDYVTVATENQRLMDENSKLSRMVANLSRQVVEIQENQKDDPDDVDCFLTELIRAEVTQEIFSRVVLPLITDYKRIEGQLKALQEKAKDYSEYAVDTSETQQAMIDILKSEKAEILSEKYNLEDLVDSLRDEVRDLKDKIEYAERSEAEDSWYSSSANC